ncbi:MAG: NAD(P)/FAD-dependent oxidoreductase [Nannocystaceae bacterium]
MAVVLGGGIGGILTAAVLSRHYERVVIVERDRLPARPVKRKGVPQDKHPHILLHRGEQIIRELVPGALESLRPQDFVPMNPGRNLRWYHGGVWKAKRDPGFDFHMCNRMRLEFALRRDVLARAAVTVLDEHKVFDLEFDDRRPRVTGVWVQRKGELKPRLLAADLVVDVTGRGTRAPQWLLRHGFGEVEVREVASNVGYTTRLFHKPGGVDHTKLPLVVMPDAPHSRRAGLVFPAGDHGLMVALAGWCRDYVPRSAEGFVAFAQSLDRPELSELLEGARPSPSEHGFRARANMWRRYDRMRRWPDGFVVLGDAVSSLNPVYGQGMTICAIETMALKHTLERFTSAERGKGLSSPGQAHRLQKRFAQVVRLPWYLVTSEDLRHDETVGHRPRGLRSIHTVVQAVHELVAYDPSAHQLFFELLNMVQSPAALLRPRFVFSVAKHLMSAKLRANLRDADAPRDLTATTFTGTPVVPVEVKSEQEDRNVASPKPARARAMKRPSLTFAQWRSSKRSGKLVQLRRIAYLRQLNARASTRTRKEDTGERASTDSGSFSVTVG